MKPKLHCKCIRDGSESIIMPALCRAVRGAGVQHKESRALGNTFGGEKLPRSLALLLRSADLYGRLRSIHGEGLHQIEIIVNLMPKACRRDHGIRQHPSPA